MTMLPMGFAAKSTPVTMMDMPYSLASDGAIGTITVDRPWSSICTRKRERERERKKGGSQCVLVLLVSVDGASVSTVPLVPPHLRNDHNQQDGASGPSLAR